MYLSDRYRIEILFEILGNRNEINNVLIITQILGDDAWSKII
jgi:hypothetical protein